MYDATRFRSSHGTYSDFVQKSAVLDLIGECKGKRILEIGSGTGRFTRELAKRGAHVVCADLSRKMHEQSRLALHCGGTDYFIMNGADLGFAGETFDACITINVMSHIKNTHGFLMEASRILRKGGFFVANFPNLSGVYFPIGGIVNMFERSLQAPVYSKWYSFEEIFHSLRSAMLDPVCISGHMILPKKHCPSFLLTCLKKLDYQLSKSCLHLLSGDLLVKSCKIVA